MLALHRYATAAALLLAACVPAPRPIVTGNPDASAQAIAEAVCATCHGNDGIGVSPEIPSLAGQSEDYLARQLEDFRAHRRSDQAAYDAMWGMSYRLTLTQARDLAALFARMRPMRSRTNEDGGLSASGARLAGNCATCHGPYLRGRGPVPRLAGQHADYLAKQLEVFQRPEERPLADARTVPPHRLAAEDIAALAAYASGLRGD